MSVLTKDIFLGLTLQNFLLHLLNFVILVVVLGLLVYRPMKKFMTEREEKYRSAKEEYDRLKKEIEELKSDSVEREAAATVEDSAEEEKKDND